MACEVVYCAARCEFDSEITAQGDWIEFSECQKRWKKSSMFFIANDISQWK